jgi:hypothetical protein
MFVDATSVALSRFTSRLPFQTVDFWWPFSWPVGQESNGSSHTFGPESLLDGLIHFFLLFSLMY